MKEFDWVELIVDKEKYKKEGVHKGMVGIIAYDKCIDGEWLVVFDYKIDISIKETDLKVIMRK